MPTSIFYDINGLITRVVVTDSDAAMAVHLPEKDETKVSLEKSQYGSFDHASFLKSVEDATGKPPLELPKDGGLPQPLTDAEIAGVKAFNDAIISGKSYADAMTASGDAQRAAAAEVIDPVGVIAVP